MKYDLEDKPGLAPMLLYGLQWWAVGLPCIIIMGVIAARLHYSEAGPQILYLRKLFGLTGLTMLAQLLIGHRLPLVVGPAAIILAGLLASPGTDPATMYGSIIIAGGLLALAAATGLIGRLRALFTPRIVVVILILIAFTICPSILKLVLGDGQRPLFHLLFGFGLTLALILGNQFLPGLWKALTVLLGVAGGSLAYFALTAFPAWPDPSPAAAADLFISGFHFDLGVIVAFILCMLALAINEIGSVESIGHLLKADGLDGRVRRGVTVTGLGNLLGGVLGVLGPVSFSLSAGLMAATGCAARRTLLPAAAGLAVCAFIPKAVTVFSLLPGSVMGALMLYLMAAQLASGLALLVSERGVGDFGSGLVVGFPVMVGLLVSFAPPAAFQELPSMLRPIISNGFVAGTVLVITLEHFIIKPK